MNSRLEQDAHDTLIGLEAMAAAHVARREAFRAAERERWARAQPPRIVGTWAPTITEQERQEREAQIQAGVLPF